MQVNITEVNNILGLITKGKDGNPLKIDDLQRMFGNGVNFDVNQAIKYKLGVKGAELDPGAKEFVDSLKVTSLLANPKAIGRLTGLLEDISKNKKILEENGKLYFSVPGDTNNTFKSKDGYDVAKKLYEVVVNGNLREFPKEKAAILTLTAKMQPGSFALLTSKLQTGPIATEAVDLLTSNYKKSYESNIENFVDRAYQVCKLDNKKDRSAVLQWAMDKNIDSEKLDKLVNICAQHKNIPATEIIKLSSRSQNVTANLEHLQKLCVAPKLEPGILKLCNNTGINPAVLNGMYGSAVDKKNVSTILAHAYEVQPNLKSKQIGDLVEQLKSMDPAQLGKLAARYEKGELYANVEVLTKELGPGGNITVLETDPHGKRNAKGLKEQFSTDTVVEKINQLKLISATDKDQRIENTILLNEKKELLQDFLAVNKFGEEHVRHLDRSQLQKLAQGYRDTLQNDSASPIEKKEAMLGYMAVSRESMYRVSGKFANSTQMLAIMNNFRAGTHVVNEVQTGQGKSIISAISASVLAASGHSVDVCTSNMDLATRDIEENGKFFDYVGTKYSKSPISQTSSKEQYSVGGINYSTIPDLSLYKQNMSFEHGDSLPKTKTALVADEFDAAANMTTVMRLAKPKEMIDKATDSQYKIVYEAANGFVASHEKDCRTKNMGELVGMMQQAIKDDNYKAFGLNSPAEWDLFVKKMAKYAGADSVDGGNTEKLGELLSAAYQASKLQEGKDFRVVSEEVPTKDGPVKISTAKVLANSLITDNVYSGGIHQCLHARLEKERTSGEGRSPYKFVINAESEVVSSQTVKNFIDGYDRLNGYTGTYGYDVELSGYSKDIQAFQVPKHQAHNRTDLEPQFAKGKEEHLDKINKFVDKLPGDVSSRQPLLIVCENDEEARAMYEAISKLRPNDPIQMVDSVKQDIDPETRLAGQKGMITIATPRMSRGTDINPDHHGGLCVVTAYADFRRVEGQIQGRAGRQAAKGLTVQILDESDLRKKLASSTGKSVTDSGKKLLKKYHQHLEQENLSSVQGKQLEGDLRQAFVLLKQSGIKAQDRDTPEKVKELHKKWNKEFSATWKDLSAQHSGDKDKIKTELFTKNPGLKEKLGKVQEAKANRSMLSYEQQLTKAQKSGSILKDSDLTVASKSAEVQASILSRGAKSATSEITMRAEDMKPEYLEFWRQKTDKDTLKALSAQERMALAPNDKNLGSIKKNIIAAITDYQDDKSNSLSKERKVAIKNLIEAVNKADSVESIYDQVKKAQHLEIASDIKKHSIFSNSKGTSYQKVLDNILDKMVATGGRKHDAEAVRKDIEGIAKLVNTQSPNNKVLKDLKPLITLKYNSEKDASLMMGLIKKCLLANMKNYNSTDKVLAENIMNNIERVDLRVTKLPKIEARAPKVDQVKTKKPFKPLSKRGDSREL